MPCIINGIVEPLNAKFLGAACRNLRSLLPMFIERDEPVVRKVTTIGIWVDRPKIFAAVVPVGIIWTLSLEAISFAIISNGIGTNPNLEFIGFAYIPCARCSNKPMLTASANVFLMVSTEPN